MPGPIQFSPTTLIQCIEYDWSVVVRCPACGHTVRWGADEIVRRFPDQLRRSLGEVGTKVAKHCPDRPPVIYTIQGAGLRMWTTADGRIEPWDWRDMRLREFLAEHGLPMDLADERRAAWDAHAAGIAGDRA